MGQLTDKICMAFDINNNSKTLEAENFKAGPWNIWLYKKRWIVTKIFQKIQWQLNTMEMIIVGPK